VGEGAAGAKGKGLVPRAGESAIRPSNQKCSVSAARHSRSGPAGLEAAQAFLTTATVPLVSQLSRQWRMISPL
jgi:hypothetical protein